MTGELLNIMQVGISFERRLDNTTGEEVIVMKVPANFRVEVDGDHRIDAKNIINNPALGPDPNRPGYNYGMYDACPLDELGRPRATEPLYNEHGVCVATALGIYDEQGLLQKGDDSLLTSKEFKALMKISENIHHHV